MQRYASFRLAQRLLHAPKRDEPGSLPGSLCLVCTHVTGQWHASKGTFYDAKLYADDQLAVYGAAQGGYALVAYNDEWPAVLACSPHDFAGVSASLAWYMEAVKQAMAAKVPSEAGLPASYGYESAVQPFVETHWGQTKPYNQLCPANTSGEHYLTGCVATAMAQI